MNGFSSGRGGRGRDGEPPVTEFAITTVDVPDRLDLREVSDRGVEDEERASVLSAIDLRAWARRLAVLGVLVAAGFGLWQWLAPLRAAIESPAIAARLSAALGAPVTIESSEFALRPSPRLVLENLSGPGFMVPEVGLEVSWPEAWRALRSGQWVWGQASIAPVSLSTAQALAIMQALPRVATSLPAGLSSLRFEGLELSDAPLFPGRFVGLARRQPDGSFGPLQFERVGGEGTLRVRVSPGEEGALGFELDGTNWRPAFGPPATWSEVVAKGRLLASPSAFEVSEYTLAGYFGSVSGEVYASADLRWVVAGTARGSGFDVESILRSLHPSAGGQAGKEEAPAVPMRGTAEFKGLLLGGGETLGEALRTSVLSGPLEIRFATLNGVNLGYAATRPGADGTSGGTTRFTELHSQVRAGGGQVNFLDVVGRAGAMATYGQLQVDADLALGGALRVDLGASRVQAPINLRVSGSALAPRFGR